MKTRNTLHRQTVGTRGWFKLIHVSVAIAGVVVVAIAPSYGQIPSLVLSNKWSIPAGSRTDLSASGDNTRGIAINKVTGNVIWATRSPVKAYIVSGVDGSDIAALNMTGVSGERWRWIRSRWQMMG